MVNPSLIKKFGRLAHVAISVILRRPAKPSQDTSGASPWVDSMTPPWVADGLITPSFDKTLLDVSSAFDVAGDR